MITPGENSTFLAFDFETANPRPDSACSIGLVRVENRKITHQEVRLIRPPDSWFVFTDIHGLTWEDVRGAPHFGDLWPEIRPLFEGVDFIAAHNSGFDTRVLAALSQRYGFPLAPMRAVCTVRLARKTWGIHPTNLPAVCRALDIELQHHEALSDARACARIVILAQEALMQKSEENLNFEFTSRA